MHESSLRFLDKDKTVSINTRNLQIGSTEMLKVMLEIFEINDSNN